MLWKPEGFGSGNSTWFSGGQDILHWTKTAKRRGNLSVTDIRGGRGKSQMVLLEIE